LGLNFESYNGIRVVLCARLMVLNGDVKVVHEVISGGSSILDSKRNSSVVLNDRLGVLFGNDCARQVVYIEVIEVAPLAIPL
jgi:hypothetical protein